MIDDPPSVLTDILGSVLYVYIPQIVAERCEGKENGHKVLSNFHGLVVHEGHISVGGFLTAILQLFFACSRSKDNFSICCFGRPPTSSGKSFGRQVVPKLLGQLVEFSLPRWASRFRGCSCRSSTPVRAPSWRPPRRLGSAIAWPWRDSASWGARWARVATGARCAAIHHPPLPPRRNGVRRPRPSPRRGRGRCCFSRGPEALTALPAAPLSLSLAVARSV